MRRYVCETVLAVAVIFFVTAGIYSRSLHAPFVFDDSTHIERNPAIRIEKVDLGSLACAAFGSPDRNRPVTNLSFALNYRVGGYNVRGYHVTNMVIHALSGVLAFVFVRASFARLAVLSDVLLRTDARRIFELSIFSALIFVVHPVQTEAVTYVVQRATALSAMFSFLALLAYVQARSTTKVWLRWLLGCGAGLAWLLGLGSKETAAVLPLVTLLYDWYFFADLRRNWLRKGFGLLALYILFSAVIAYVYFHGRPVEWFAERYSRASFSMWQRLLTETRVVVFYLSLLFFPHPSRLNLIHRFPTSVSMFDPPSTFLSFATIVGLVGLGVLCAGKERWVSFCIFWYLIWLALESSVLPLWIIFEHRLYLSALSFAALVPYLFHRWLRRPRWLLPVLLSTGVLLMSGASYVRNGVWTSAEGLWRDVISKNPDSPVAHGNLGDIMLVQGRLAEAAVCFQNVLRCEPSDVMAHVRLGVVFQRQGKIKEAIKQYLAALEFKTNEVAALNNLAWLHAVSRDAQVRNPQKAVLLALLAQKHAHQPQPELLDTYAAACAATGEFSMAVKFAEEARRLAFEGRNEQLAREIEKRLKLYREGKPYFED